MRTVATNSSPTNRRNSTTLAAHAHASARIYCTSRRHRRIRSSSVTYKSTSPTSAPGGRAWSWSVSSSCGSRTGCLPSAGCTTRRGVPDTRPAIRRWRWVEWWATRAYASSGVGCGQGRPRTPATTRTPTSVSGTREVRMEAGSCHNNAGYVVDFLKVLFWLNIVGSPSHVSRTPTVSYSRVSRAPVCLSGACFSSATMDGSDYRGSLDYSEDGITCQRWTSTYPHNHTTLTGNIRLDEQYGLGPHNHCRNPAGRRARPWCYVLLRKTVWQYCDVQICPRASLGNELGWSPPRTAPSPLVSARPDWFDHFCCPRTSIPVRLWRYLRRCTQW